jgi:hypothetical protein
LPSRKALLRGPLGTIRAETVRDRSPSIANKLRGGVTRLCAAREGAEGLAILG